MTVREQLECDGCDRREYLPSSGDVRSWARVRIDVRDYKTAGSETSFLLDVCPNCQTKQLIELLDHKAQKLEKEAPRG